VVQGGVNYVCKLKKMREEILKQESSDGKKELQKSHEDIEKEREYVVVKTKIGVIFKTYQKGKERVDSMKENLARIMKLHGVENTIGVELDQCANIKDKREFIEQVFKLIKPLVDLTIKYPELNEKDPLDDFERIQINELLVCHMKKNIAEIHIRPRESLGETIVKLKNGLEILAEIVNKNKDIEMVKGESWIIARHPKIIEKFGFVIDETDGSAIGKTTRSAHMTREDFLKKYLNQSENGGVQKRI
jgi:hypothetical protein